MELPEIPSALFASSKYTKMENTVTPVLTLKVVFLFVDQVGLSALSNAGKSDVCNFFLFFAGVCAMCGKQVLDTKFYKQSNV